MKSRKSVTVLLITAGALLVGATAAYLLWLRSPWSQAETAMLRSLWIGSLPKLPPDPSNAYGDNPQAAVLGQKLFFDNRFSANGQVACATCHLPEKQFQDGMPRAVGVGVTNRRTMPLTGTAYSPWFFWDGRRDSLWAQALAPMENPMEHGGDRTMYAHLIEQFYREEYEALFGPLPDVSQLPEHAAPVEDSDTRATWEALSETEREEVSSIYANMGKAIAAYERQLLPGASRFDGYVAAIVAKDYQTARAMFTPDETAGLRLFIGKANCTQCHNGPLFTDNHFHNTGIPAVADLPEDTGRALGAAQVLADEFNCLGKFSDAGPDDCAELRFMVAEGHELVRQYKPPSLRGAADRAPYMHAGQMTTLEDVLAHYNQAPEAPNGDSEILPLELTQREEKQIIAFLKTLDAPVDADPKWLRAPER